MIYWASNSLYTKGQIFYFNLIYVFMKINPFNIYLYENRRIWKEKRRISAVLPNIPAHYWCQTLLGCKLRIFDWCSAQTTSWIRFSKVSFMKVYNSYLSHRIIDTRLLSADSKMKNYEINSKTGILLIFMEYCLLIVNT